MSATRAVQLPYYSLTSRWVVINLSYLIHSYFARTTDLLVQPLAQCCDSQIPYTIPYTMFV